MNFKQYDDGKEGRFFVILDNEMEAGWIQYKWLDNGNLLANGTRVYEEFKEQKLGICYQKPNMHQFRKIRMHHFRKIRMHHFRKQGCIIFGNEECMIRSQIRLDLLIIKNGFSVHH